SGIASRSLHRSIARPHAQHADALADQPAGARLTPARLTEPGAHLIEPIAGVEHPLDAGLVRAPPLEREIASPPCDPGIGRLLVRPVEPARRGRRVEWRLLAR